MIKFGFICGFISGTLAVLECLYWQCPIPWWYHFINGAIGMGITLVIAYLFNWR